MTINKGADQSIRSLSRLLKLLMSKGMRNHLSKSMEDLIRLYRVCEEKNGLPIQDVKEFLKRITKEDLEYNEETRKFVKGHYSIVFGKKQKGPRSTCAAGFINDFHSIPPLPCQGERSLTF